jgi:hypothetical protein
VVRRVKKKGRDLAALCAFGWGFGRDPSYDEYCGLVANRHVVDNRRAESVASGMRLATGQAVPQPEYFLGLQDEEDPDQAALDAARSMSDLMAARELARRGVS